MKCSKCDQEAAYDSPKLLCAGHWFDWFHEGYVEDGTLTQKQYDKERREFVKNEN